MVKGWPRLSETFIAQEILGLERRGLDQIIVSMRRPTDSAVHAIHTAIRAPVLYLPEYLRDEPARVLVGLVRSLGRRGFVRAFGLWLADLARDPTLNRVRRFGQACVLAGEMPADVGWLHCHFLHAPGSVTRYAAAILGRAWSFSAHAKDIWTQAAWEKRRKLADACWGVTCTRHNLDHLRELASDPTMVELIYHGLDFARFPHPGQGASQRDGTDPDDPVRLLSVGRAVAKKGFEGLIAALAALPGDLSWHWTHVGSGERLPALKAAAERAGIGARVTWLGALPQDEVIAAMQRADLFILNCRRTADGDMDGLPNVLMEAQALGLACLSTRLSAIPEVIEDGVTGVLVPPDDPPALGEAMRALIGDPGRRRRLAAAACESVRTRFACDPELDRLKSLLDDALAESK